MLEMGKIFPDPLNMDYIKNMDRRELTLEEKEKPYSKYFNKELAVIPQSDLDIVNKGAIDPEKALPLQERDKMMDLGYLDTETGYTLMSDKSGFAATLVKMPGVTPEMLDWWFNWHPLEGLRYALWCPVAHSGITVKDKEKHLDSSGTPLRERNYGGVHYPVEGFNIKQADVLRIEFFSPKDFGLDLNKFKEPNISRAYLANVIVDKNNMAINTFFHAVREVEGGVEFRSRYWLGYSMVDGVLVRKNKFVPKKIMRHMARNNCIHSLTEYNNLASFLPQLYTEMNGKIDE